MAPFRLVAYEWSAAYHATWWYFLSNSLLLLYTDKYINFFSFAFQLSFTFDFEKGRIAVEYQLFFEGKKNRCQCFASFQKTRNVSPTRCAVLSPLFGWNLPNNSSGDCALWMEMLWHCVTHPGSCFSPFQISELKIYTAVAIQSGKRNVYLLSIRTWYLSLSVSTEMAFHGSSMAVPWQFHGRLKWNPIGCCCCCYCQGLALPLSSIEFSTWRMTDFASLMRLHYGTHFSVGTQTTRHGQSMRN